MDQMRMDTNGKNLVCRNCLERKNPAKQAPLDEEDYITLKSGNSRSVSPAAKKQSDKVSYFCKACKYSFSRAAHIEISTCPYCSQSGMLTKKGTAASMVKEIEDMADEE